MLRSLLGCAFVLGLLVWGCGLLLTQRGKTGQSNTLDSFISPPFWIAALLVPLAGFAATLPTRAPFAAGQGLGVGLLLGAAGAIIGAWTLTRALDTRESGPGCGQNNGGAVGASFGLAISVVCLPLLLMRGVVLDALMGVAMGGLTATLLLLCGLNAQREAGRLLALALAAGVAWTTTLCGFAALGELGGGAAWGANMASVPWSAIALPLASSVPLLLMLCALTGRGAAVSIVTNLSSQGEREATSTLRINLLRWTVAGAFLLLTGAQVAHKIGAHPDLFRLLGMGLLASGLSWWMLTARLRTIGTNGAHATWHALALPLLLFMAAGMVAFQMLAGVGVGVMLLGAWFTGGLALLDAWEAGGATQNAVDDGQEPATTSSWGAYSAAQGLLYLLCFGALLLLYRLFEVRYQSDIHNVLLPDHYALLGLVVGVAVPGALAGFVNACNEEQTAPRHEVAASVFVLLPRLIAAGIFALSAPALLLILFGTKCLLCLFFGLMLAPLLDGATQGATLENAANTAKIENTEGIKENAIRLPFRPVSPELLTALLALAVGLAVAQWTRHVLPVSLMARADKVRLIKDGVGVAVLFLLIADIAARLNRYNALLLSRSASVGPDATPKGGAR